MDKLLPHSRPWLAAADNEALLRAVAEERTGGGEYSAALARAMEAYSGMAQCHLYASGTLALRGALEALALPAGSGVAIPSFTCAAVMMAVVNAGLKPVVVDCDENGLCLSEEVYRLAGGGRIAAAVAAHQFGLINRAMEGAASILPVIEDCAHAPPRRYLTGSAAVIGSMESSKLISCGEGGYLLADQGGDEPELEARMRLSLGGKLSGLLAALAIKQLERLEQNLRIRREIAGEYMESMGGDSRVVNGERAAWHSFFIRMDSAESVSRAISAAQDAGVEFKKPITPYPLHRYMGAPAEQYPNSERLWETLISIPIYPSMERGEIGKVRRILEKLRGGLSTSRLMRA